MKYEYRKRAGIVYAHQTKVEARLEVYGGVLLAKINDWIITDGGLQMVMNDSDFRERFEVMPSIED